MCYLYIYINRIRMFVCLSVGYTLLIKPNSIHTLYMEEAEFIGEVSYQKINSIPTTLLRL